MPRLFIGTSGWNYDHWQSDFYAGVKRKNRLRHYAERFNAVEANATFYRLQNKQTFERWYDETPPQFRFSIKGNRFLTHNKKLNDPLESISLERQHALGLGDKLAAVLWQLPPNFHKNIERLRAFCQVLKRWDDTRHVLEFRHASWFDDEVAETLGQHGIANCRSDAADWPLWDEVTTDLVYLRLHGHTRTYTSSYSKAGLSGHASQIRKWHKARRTVHVYFDNDAAGAAPKDAKRLLKMVAEE